MARNQMRPVFFKLQQLLLSANGGLILALERRLWQTLLPWPWRVVMILQE